MPWHSAQPSSCFAFPCFPFLSFCSSSKTFRWAGKHATGNDQPSLTGGHCFVPAAEWSTTLSYPPFGKQQVGYKTHPGIDHVNGSRVQMGRVQKHELPGTQTEGRKRECITAYHKPPVLADIACPCCNNSPVSKPAPKAIEDHKSNF